MDAAIQQFAREGYASASLRKIAVEAQVDPALINHLYGGKEWLWRACIDQVANKVLARLNAATTETTPSLQHAAECLVDVVCDEPIIANFILAEISRHDTRFAYVNERLVRPILDVLHGSLGERTAHLMSNEVRLVAMSGAIATTVASKAFIARSSQTPFDNQALRTELKAVVSLLSAVAPSPANKRVPDGA